MDSLQNMYSLNIYTFLIPILDFTYKLYRSRGMGFPTMWYVRLAKPQISLRICAVWSEPLQVAVIFIEC